LLGKFSVSQPSPMSLNSLHVPLIDNSNNIFMIFQSVQLSENSLISIIDQNSFLFRCYFIEKCYKEINSTTINWLSECLSSSHMQCVHEIIILRSPTRTDFHCVSEPSIQKCMRIKVRFWSKRFYYGRIKSMTSEKFSHIFTLSMFQSVVGLETRN